MWKSLSIRDKYVFSFMCLKPDKSNTLIVVLDNKQFNSDSFVILQWAIFRTVIDWHLLMHCSIAFEVSLVHFRKLIEPILSFPNS